MAPDGMQPLFERAVSAAARSARASSPDEEPGMAASPPEPDLLTTAFALLAERGWAGLSLVAARGAGRCCR